ncbi:MAG: TrbG/VirB9 family P-type conjugative transfer protein [Spirochaetaceae bacterium]|nr:TrbG/VirB9 family P-type conjugative transfer protein [Spirochaetaceae bacterium]
MKRLLLILLLISISLISCKTVDLEPKNEVVEEKEIELGEVELKNMKIQLQVDELMKENDLEPTFIVVEEPKVYELSSLPQEKNLSGTAALKQNLEDITIIPEYKDGRLQGWVYRENAVYKVICQTYHSTMILFEPGEELVENPYISESEVWKISRGIGQKDGLPQHHLVIKPDYSGLNSTLIVVTNKRIYQMELESTKTTYMPKVSWVYPRAIQDSESWIRWQQSKQLTTEFTGVDPEVLSFDYKMRHPVLNKPNWLPTQVYDDGIKTYIILDNMSLLTEYPVAFNERNEIINYRTKENTIIIDQLIEKVTLRLGKQKVIITKKKGD